MAAAQLLSPPGGDSRVHGQLVADNRLAVGAPWQLDTLNLWRKLTVLSHGQSLAGATAIVTMPPLCVQ